MYFVHLSPTASTCYKPTTKVLNRFGQYAENIHLYISHAPDTEEVLLFHMRQQFGFWYCEVRHRALFYCDVSKFVVNTKGWR